MSRCKKMGLLPACIAGITAVILLTAFLCLLLTPVYLHGLLPPETGPVCSLIALGLSVFICVWLLSGIRSRQAMPTAGIVAGGIVLLASLICALGGRGFAFGPWLLRLASAAAIGGAAGAVMSIRPHGKRRRAYRRG